MCADPQRLRRVCSAYPRHTVVEAVGVALRATIADARARQDLASLVTSWLMDQNEGMEPPPLAPEVVVMIERELRARAH
jgi:hypothetical protein